MSDDDRILKFNNAAARIDAESNIPGGVFARDRDTGHEWIRTTTGWLQTKEGGIPLVKKSNDVVYPQYSGLTISYDLASTQAPVMDNVIMYHYGHLVITLGGTSTINIKGRMADGVTYGTLIATGPAGTKVALSGALAVGLYTLDRIDCVALVFDYTQGSANSAIRGRLGGG